MSRSCKCCHALVAYGPTESTREGVRKRAFWTVPDGAVEEVSNHERFFLPMDVNAYKGLREGGGRLESEHCPVLGASGRNMLNDNGEYLLAFASKDVALVNTFFSTPKNSVLSARQKRGWETKGQLLIWLERRQRWLCYGC